MYDVIVVGAGIGGAAAAYVLGRVGQQVLVLQQRLSPATKPAEAVCKSQFFAAFLFPSTKCLQIHSFSFGWDFE